jgi:plastocyanin
MKKILSSVLGFILLTNMNAQTTFTINKGVGNSFNPIEITVTQGDIVHFNLSTQHAILQVSQETWNANGITPLPGGFSLPTGSGDYTAATPGTIYYVCTEHVASDGMKGTIIVNAITGIIDINRNSDAKLYPNPATSFITYRTSMTSSVNEIRILDITGRTVKILHKPEVSDSQIRIDIEKLNKGIYFILVKSEDGIESGKFLKS